MSPVTIRSSKPADLSVLPKASGFSLFRGMPAAEVQGLERFCSPQIFASGEILFEEGHAMTDIFLVQRGCAKFYKTSPNKRRTVFSIFGEGDVFELRTADEKEIHLFSALAITETVVLSVAPQYFYGNFMANPRFASQLLHQKIRTIKHFYFSQLVASESVETRMAYFLLTLAQHPGMSHWDGKKLMFDVPLTRRDIAEIVNTSVETSIRVMGKWSRHQLISISKRRLVIENVSAFKKIIAGLPFLSR